MQHAGGVCEAGPANSWLGGGAQWGAMEAAMRSSAGAAHPLMQGMQPAPHLSVVQAAAAAAATAAAQAVMGAGGSMAAAGEAAQCAHAREHMWASAWPSGLFEDVGELGGERGRAQECCGDESGAQGQQVSEGLHQVDCKSTM